MKWDMDGGMKYLFGVTNGIDRIIKIDPYLPQAYRASKAIDIRSSWLDTIGLFCWKINKFVFQYKIDHYRLLYDCP
jgi:hypothetical protein